MAGAIAANPNPISFDAGFGKIVVSGQVKRSWRSTRATRPTCSQVTTRRTFDIDNALVTVQKSDGMFQFYVQAGLYSFPTVGVPYDKASDQNSLLGPLPVAYGKLQLTDSFSISAGKLPTLVGAELAFTPQNINIERGLLWWQEPITSRGVQANYASGPLSIALSWNDGFYTNVWNTGSGLISYAFNSANTLAFDASFTPDYSRHLRQPDLRLDVHLHRRSVDHSVPMCNIRASTISGGSDWGIGVLASYQFNPQWSLNGRVEYEDFLRHRLAADLWTEELGLVDHGDADLAEEPPLRPRRTVLCRRCPIRPSASARPSATTTSSAPCWKPASAF